MKKHTDVSLNGRHSDAVINAVELTGCSKLSIGVNVSVCCFG